MASAIAWFIDLGTDPGRFATESAMVLGIGLLLFAGIAAAGLIFTGGRWARRLGIVVAAASLILGGWREPSWWAAVAVLAAAVALAGLLGPWLKGWVRELPAADGPGAKPIFLVLGSLGLVPLVAITSPAGLDVSHGVLAAAGVFLAWGYSRANLWALWGLRVALPILAVPALLNSAPAGAVILGIAVAFLTWLAWSREARLAVQPLMDRLPPPRLGSPKDGAR
jgi:hypothetical protein